MYINPFYNFRVGKDAVEIHDYFQNNARFNICTSDPKAFYKKIIAPAINSGEGLFGEDEQIKSVIKSLVKGTGDVFLYRHKDEQFYKKLLDLIVKVNKDYPGLDVYSLKNYMVEHVTGLSAVVIYDKTMYPDNDIRDIFPFRSTIVFEIGDIDKEQLSKALSESEWLIIAADTKDERLLSAFSKTDINNHKLMIIYHDLKTKKVYLGPILIPSCTGGIERLNKTDFSSDEVEFRNEFLIEPIYKMNDSIFSKYVYAEIMNFILDGYSNYSTEYSRLSGTQYEIDYDKCCIRRRELIL